MPKRRAKAPSRRNAKPAAPKPKAKGKIRIYYKLTGNGWAYAKVRSGATVLETMVSYVHGSGIDGPLKATLELIEGDPTMTLSLESGEEREIPADTGFFWEDEPGVWKWTLTYVDRCTLNVKLRTSPTSDTPADDAPPVIDVDVDATEWCEQLLTLSEKLLRRHGIAGYRASWDTTEFPLGLYLRLLRYRHREFRLGINWLAIGPMRSRLADELTVLRRLSKPRR